MHDLLFERQGEWAVQTPDEATETFIGYAKGLGLDDKKFSRDLKGGAYRDLVQRRYNEATILSLASTPTIFLNGQYYGSLLDEFYLGGFIKLYNYHGKQYAAPPPMSIDPAQPYFALVKTSQGSFCIELFAKQAPQTVNNFVFLAQDGFYDGVLFHVVLPGVVAQTGDPTGGGFGGPGYEFADEFSPDLSHDGPGVVSMFNKGSPNTNGSQFFIIYQAMLDLDNKYPIFGRVVEGMDVVEGLTPRNPQQDPYAPADTIETITIDSKCES